MPDRIPPAPADPSGPSTGESPVVSRSSVAGSSATATAALRQSGKQRNDFARYAAVRRPGGGVLVFGVILPLFTILYELYSRLCAASWFDPLPTWWHLALVALVPLSNLLVFATRYHPDPRYRAWLAHLNAAALGVTVAYGLAFLPYAPISAMGVIAFGMGAMPLSPILAFFATLSARRSLPHWGRVLGEEPAPMPRALPWVLAVGAVLAAPFAPLIFTRYELDKVARAEPAERVEHLQMLRWLGSEREMLDACYPIERFGFFDSREWRNEARIEKARETFFRVTGTPFNKLPAPAAFGAPGFAEIHGWNGDLGLGGEKVASKVAGLSLEASRLDGKIDTSGLTSYTEWTLVFKNVARDSAEARLQVALPPGGVVSRVTLWIDGEPREAAFGGRAQVRAAYQEVAVVKRRDPVLVTTAGPNRVLVQCFPVPPGGKEMKVRLGITAPLGVRDVHTATFAWPQVVETNFTSSAALRHEAWIESTAPLSDGAKTFRREWNETALASAPPLRLVLEDAQKPVLSDDPDDPAFVIRQSVRAMPVESIPYLIVVVDGSRLMSGSARAVRSALASLPANQTSVIFAGDFVERWPGTGTAEAWLAARDFAGGRDNIPALEAAWDEAIGHPGAAILWVHGPQPVLLSRLEGLLQRGERSAVKPPLFALAAAPGPNRILEQLDTPVRWEPVVEGDHFAERLARFLAYARGSAGRFVIERQRLPRAEAAPTETPADRHIARLWGREEIERLRVQPAKLDDAVKLALQLQLVTPVSGAVVLERKEQYERHGLKPGDPETVPTVPEPGAAAVLLATAAALGLRRPPRRAE